MTPKGNMPNLSKLRKDKTLESISEEDILNSQDIKDSNKKAKNAQEPKTEITEEEILNPKSKKGSAGPKINPMVDLFAKDLGKGCKVATDILGSDIAHWYPVGCAPVDIVLGGGIPSGKVVELFGWESSGKCLAEGTKISLSDNSIKNIEDVRVGDSVLCLDGDLKTNKTSVVEICSQVQDCFKVTLRDGRTIEASKNHPFFTVYGWRKLEDLVVGDSIATPSRVTSDNSKQFVTPCEAELIGMYLGDGNLSHTPRVYFHAEDKYLINRYKSLIHEFDCLLEVKQVKSKGNSVRMWVTNCIRKQKSSLCLLFERVGIKDLVREDKFIPDCIINSSDDVIIACLRGLFATDGHIGWDTKIKRVNISFTQKSEFMVRQVQHLLLRLGILSKIRFRLMKNQTEGKVFPSYTLDVCSTRSKLTFLDVIRDYDKPLVKKCLSVIGSMGEHSIYDTIPKEIYSHIELLCAESWNRMFPKLRRKDVRKLNSSRDNIEYMGSILKDDFLLKLSKSDIFWDRIVSIDSVGSRTTYDLQTVSIGGQEPNFVANDIFVHNSTLSLEFSKAFVNYWKSQGDDNYVVLWIESESALDKVRAHYIGCDLERFIIVECDTVENGFDIIRKALEKAQENKMHVFICWDTIAAVLTDNEKAGDIYAGGMGEKARIIRRILKDISNPLGHTNSTLVFVNQMYKTFSQYGEKDEVPGGGGIKFHASIRGSLKKDSQPIEETLPNGNKVTRAIATTLHTKKNKLTLPYQSCQLVINVERGLDTLETLVRFLILHKYIIVKGGWKYIEFGDDEYKFQNTDRLKEIITAHCPELQDYMDYLCYKHYSGISPLMKVKLLDKLWDFETKLYGKRKTKISEEEYSMAALLGRSLLEEQDRM